MNIHCFNTIVASLGCICLLETFARAAILAYEPFTNAPGTDIIGSADGSGFSNAWQSNNSQGVATNTSYGLSYVDAAGRALVTVGGAGFFQGHTVTNGSMQLTRLFNFSRGTNGSDGVTTWISFLIARQGPTGTLSGNSYGRGANVPHDFNAGSLQKLAIGNSSGVGSNTVALIPLGNAANCRGDANSAFGGRTNFVVVRVDHIAGGNDAAWLFVNPLLSVEPDTNSPGAVSLGAFDFSFDRLRMFAGGQSSAAQPYAEIVVDEYRLGETFADVTPYTGGSAPGTLTFTNARLAGANVVLSGQGGSAGGSYQLLANGDLNQSSSTWPVIGSGNFDASGNFVITQSVLTGSRFFRARTGTVSAVAPAILSGPASISVTQAQAASFSVSASGTAPLFYQWFFNTNNSLSGQTGTNLVFTSAQVSNAGVYSVRVSNAGGSVTSAPAFLAVLAPPAIVSQPQNVTVLASNSATFSVTAIGTAPLSYRWYLNTNTPLPGGINSSYVVNAALTNDAGIYSVVVTNSYGSVTSSFARLTVIEPQNFIDFSHVGFADNGTPVTGGAAGPTVYVGSEEELATYSDANPPYVIIITNSFTLSGMSTHIRNNKTVIGTNNIVLTGGGLYLYRSTNVIVRNLTISESTEDGFGLHYSANVWIDHCSVLDSTDGGIDITQESDNVTISWCRFGYSTAPSGSHNFVSLIGSSDADTGTYRVTYHHNWWDTGCAERMPSVRFGRAHVFNNYFNAPGNNYCTRTRKEAECRVENNFYQNVQNPWEQYITGSGDVQGKLFATNNSVALFETANNVTWTGSTTNGDGTIRIMLPGTDVVFTPPYAYTPHAAVLVPSIVTNNAGANRGPFVP